MIRLNAPAGVAAASPAPPLAPGKPMSYEVEQSVQPHSWHSTQQPSLLQVPPSTGPASTTGTPASTTGTPASTLGHAPQSYEHQLQSSYPLQMPSPQYSGTPASTLGH